VAVENGKEGKIVAALENNAQHAVKWARECSNSNEQSIYGRNETNKLSNLRVHRHGFHAHMSILHRVPHALTKQATVV